MSSAACSQLKNECRKWLNIVYVDHNPDPLASVSFKPRQLSSSDIEELSEIATTNEILKCSRGNGNGNQTIYSGMNAFGEVPNISNETNSIQICQQFNVGNGFAPLAPSTWAKRVLSDHLRRGKCDTKAKDIFDDNMNMNGQPIKAVPMKVNLRPDWDPKQCNFLNGQQIDAYYKSANVWSTKGYFSGSMITALCDPRQISIIIETGYGIIQSAVGLLPYRPGDLIQIPPHTPFSFYVKKGDTVKCVSYYSKEDLLFPTKQLNVADLNQVPFSPSVVVQCKYSYNEHSQYQDRPEYARIEQSDGSYSLYYFGHCKTAFNFFKYVHNGPVLHKVNLIDNFERIGTNKGHKDPNLWLILGHASDKSFGIALITGKSLIEVGASENDRITYPPAYFHLNGVQEKGELIKFSSDSNETYDARKGFKEGDCLLHVAGVGHGADRDIYKHFIIYAIIKYILEHKNSKAIIRELINPNKFQRFASLDQQKREQRIAEYTKKMYAFDFVNEYNDNENISFNVTTNINKAIDAIVNAKSEVGKNDKHLQVLGIPFGMGYLMVECRDMPIIPRCAYNSTFREMTEVQYGMDVYPLIVNANKYLTKLNKQHLRSSL